MDSSFQRFPEEFLFILLSKQSQVLSVMMVEDIDSLLVFRKCTIKFSMILRSGDCGGHIRYSTSLECSSCHSDTILAVCIGALSSWKISFPFVNSSATIGWIWSDRIINIFYFWPYHEAEPLGRQISTIYPPTITEPPSCLTVGRRQSESNVF